MTENIFTDKNYYMSGGIRVSFYYDEERGLYEIVGIKGTSEELLIPDKINGISLGDIDGYYEGELWFDRDISPV